MMGLPTSKLICEAGRLRTALGCGTASGVYLDCGGVLFLTIPLRIGASGVAHPFLGGVVNAKSDMAGTDKTDFNSRLGNCARELKLRVQAYHVSVQNARVHFEQSVSS